MQRYPSPSATPIAVLIPGLLALMAVGWAHDLSHPPFQGITSVGSALREVIALPGHTLIFKPTRDDMTVGSVVLSVYCSNPEDVRLNGVRLDVAWREVRLTEAGGIVVNRSSRAVSDASEAWTDIYLEQVATNQFSLPPLKIESSANEPGGQLCVSVKAWFKEVTNQYDSMYYESLDDRYALASWCKTPPESRSPVGARFRQNRVPTAEEFKATLSKPMVIRLNQRPLPGESLGSEELPRPD